MKFLPYIFPTSLWFCTSITLLAQSYQYDAAGRLTAVAYADNTGLTFTYDASGNRLTQTFISGVAAAPKITAQPIAQSVGVGAAVTFSVSASGSPAPTFQWRKDGSAISGATGPSYTIPAAQASDAGSYSVAVTNNVGTADSNAASLTVSTGSLASVAFSSSPDNKTTSVGGLALFTTAASAQNGGATPSYQWQKDGRNITGATSTVLVVNSVQPKDTGLYAAIATNSGGSAISFPAILGVTTTAKVVGSASEVGSNIRHVNGNVYDQVLMLGAAATVKADPGQVTRISFIDLTDDIVQLEFSGSGSLSIVLDSVSGPMLAENYTQPGVTYMKGHAGIVIVGADDTTNVSAFSVGSITAVNQSLFSPNINYDGMADLAYIAIQSNNGKFGGVRAANTNFFATRGFTGLYAPGVTFTGPVFVGNISAYDAAVPLLITGSASDVRITGGDFWQPNGQPVLVNGFSQLKFADGITSHGLALPAQVILGRVWQNGVDVTNKIVIGPVP